MIVYKDIELEIDLDEFDTEDLIYELEGRGYIILGRDENKSEHNIHIHEVVKRIYELKITGKDYTKELDELIWQTIGRM